MSYQDDFSDNRAEMRALYARIERLERASPLENSSITSGRLRIGVEAGIIVDPVASITAGEAQLSGAHGGKVGAGGTWVSSDGVIRNDNGTIAFEDRIDPLDGVNVTWNGARHTIEQVTGWLQGDIDTVNGKAGAAQSAANAAQSTANGAASAASAAQSTANSAQTKANSNASRLDSLEAQMETMSSLYATLANAHNALKANYELHLNEFHGGWPNG